MAQKYFAVVPLASAILLAACGESKKESIVEDAPTMPHINFTDLNGNGSMDIYEDASQSIDVRVDDILSRLSIEQKTKLVQGTGMNPEDYTNSHTRVPGAAGYTYPLESLGIESIVLADGPAGLRILPTREGTDDTFYATAFPVATALASSWDVDLLTTVGEAMGHEVLEYGVDILLAPGMNIHRNPLGGRNFEYYSEDPLLSGKLAAAMVKGTESNGVGTTLKHFVANNQETNRFLVDTIVSERALREIYLRGFEIAVKDAQPWAIMSSYNQLNGTYTPQDRELLTDLLRGEWGYEGLVMTDWFAGDNAVQQMQAGNDLIMPGTDEFADQLTQAVTSGDLEESVLDTNLRRILTVILKSRTFSGYDYSDTPDLEANAKVARQAAAEGVVLLKNTDTLPFSTSIKNIAVLGNTSYDFISGGAGSGDVQEAYTVSLMQALEENGYQLNETLESSYLSYLEAAKASQPEQENLFMLAPVIPEMALDQSVLEEAAQSSDIGLLTIGRNSGEFHDRTVEGDFDLTEAELSLIANASNAFHGAGKKLVVVLNIGNVVETASWRDQVDGIVLPWQGGQEAGHAVVDVLTGKVNPSGKLATTFPLAYSDVPSAKNFPGEILSDDLISGIGGFAQGNPSRVTYEEGIYVGYRYYDAFNMAPSFEFGYGLSYTDFTYEALSLSSQNFDSELTASVTIKNTGKVAGKEVVQLYLSAPSNALNKPVKELKGFAKTRMLEPGESQQLQFTLTPRDLASFDEASSSWVAEAGEYMVSIGASSRDIRQQAKFKLAEPLEVEKGPTDLESEKAIEELVAP